MNKLYWFSLNLSAYILLLIFGPIRFVWGVVVYARKVFIVDGSERIQYPWEWEWKEK